MSYDLFLLVMSQLSTKRKASIVLHGNVISIETQEKANQWKLSTPIYCGDECIPQAVRACVSSNGTLRWQVGGPYVKLSPKSHSVLLIQEISLEKGKYLPFKHHLNDFQKVAEEWREFLGAPMNL